MPRWVWFAPFALLALAFGVWAFRLGWIAVTLTETDVITAYSALYLDERGADARLTDCTAQPGPIPSVWILVTCISRDDTRYDYPVDRFGRLLQIDPAPALSGAPQT
ncbi:MAG: hypothetical protein AAF601_16715 [Pseudomonadota bacterium]